MQNSRAALIGNYHGTSSEYITVLEGIREEAGDDVRILYSQDVIYIKTKLKIWHGIRTEFLRQYLQRKTAM